jgi:protein O-GlcNAc transferase
MPQSSGGGGARRCTATAAAAAAASTTSSGSPQQSAASSNQRRQQAESASAQQPAPPRGVKRGGAASSRIVGFLLLLATLLTAAYSFVWPQLLPLQPPPPLQHPEHAAAVTRDGMTCGPSLGTFPRGCQWRDVSSNASSSVHYQYWQQGEDGGSWTDEQPPACRLQGYASPGPPRPWRMFRGNPRTEVVPGPHAVSYRNLWYNAGRWYALVDGERAVPSWRFSKNHEVAALHVTDARRWLNTSRWRVVPGDTLLFDYIFFVHPTAIGHWWELAGPLFSVLKKGGGAGGFKRPADQMVLLHLKRTHLMEWVRAVMAVALGVRAQQGELPPILLQQETDHPWQQLSELSARRAGIEGGGGCWLVSCVCLCSHVQVSCSACVLPSLLPHAVATAAMPLEGVSRDEWIMFDHVLIVRDLFTGGNRSFASTQDAREFRAAVYKQYGEAGGAGVWSGHDSCSGAPQPGAPPPSHTHNTATRPASAGQAPPRAAHHHVSAQGRQPSHLERGPAAGPAVPLRRGARGGVQRHHLVCRAAAGDARHGRAGVAPHLQPGQRSLPAARQRRGGAHTGGGGVGGALGPG